MIPADLTYDWPQALYGMFLSLIFIWLFWRFFLKAGHGSNQAAMPALVSGRSSLLFWLRALFFVLSWFFAIMAIMQPKGNERYPASAQQASKKNENQAFTLQRKAHDVIFLIDASASMGISDTRSGQTRLNAAKEIADELISRLKGENAAVYAFTATPSKVSPLTLDYLFARLMLKNIQINEGGAAGTNFYSALSQLNQEYFQNAGPKLRTVVILSDGGDNDIESASGADKEAKMASILALLNNADALHLRVYAIGLGSQKGEKIPEVSDNGKPVISHLEPSLLQRISTKGRGKYLEESQKSIVDIASSIMADLAQENPYVDTETVELSYSLSSEDKVYSYFFQWPLALSILFLILALFLPERGKSAVLLLFFMIEPAYGAELAPYAQEKMRQAAIDQEAGAYREALDAYQSFSDLPLDDWQKAILHYDKATVLLSAKQYAESVKLLSELTIDPDLPVLLKRRAFTNLAIGRFLLAEEKLKEKKNIQGKIQANFFFIRAQEAVEEALKADCQVVRLEGGVKCEKPLDLEEIAFAIRLRRADIIEEAAKERISNISLEEGIALLYTSIDQLVKAAQLAERSDKPLTPSYAEWVSWQGESSLPLWPLVQTKMEKEPVSFKAARSKFESSLASLQKGRLNTARLELLESKSKLDAFVEEKWGANALHVFLTRLLDHFRPLLSQDVMQQNAVDALLAEANLLKSDNKAIQEGIEHIQDGISQSSKQLKAGQPIFAKMLLLQEWRLLSGLLKQEKTTPRDFLQNAIDEQQYALAQNQLWLRLEPKEQQNEGFQRIVATAQQGVLQTADSYLPFVLKWQEDLFHSTTGNQTCQCKPWDIILPLFNKGYQEAVLSLKRLQKPLSLARIALESQDQTLRDWQMALEAKEEEKEQQQEQPQQAPSTQQQKDEKQRELPSNVNDVLQTLQDMQKADQQPMRQVPVIQKGSKPW